MLCGGRNPISLLVYTGGPAFSIPVKRAPVAEDFFVIARALLTHHMRYTAIRFLT